jgi:Tol biopolymer transport system component
MRWMIPVIGLLLLPSLPASADESAGSKIIYSRKDGDRYRLHVMNADGTGDRLLSGPTANVNLFPSSSPDGKRIAFSSGPSLGTNEIRISIINADGTGLKTLNLPHQPAAIPAWSPDGKRLAYTAGEENPNVYVIDVDGGTPRQINPPTHGGMLPFWFPDGKRLGYTRAAPAEDKAQLVIASLDGGTEEMLVPLTTPLLIAGPHALSPDGKRLLYAILERKDNSVSLRLRDLVANTEQILIAVKLSVPDGPERLPTPAWAPDGRSFLITLIDDKGVGVFRVSEDGKSKTRLTPPGVDCCSGAWAGGR